MRELWRNALTNSTTERLELSLDSQADIKVKNPVLATIGTATQTIAGLHLWNWIQSNDAKGRTLGVSKVTNPRRRAIHVANRATSQEIADLGSWWIDGRSILC